ncbi:MAG: amidohydrolase family protein [Methanosphaera sp.]|nr:amidohydrolase family protein [Methanosphaera sp.]
MSETTSILIENATIISDDIQKGSLLIVDNKIEEIGNNLSGSDADKVIDATDKIVMPGLINTHSHVAMTLLRSVGDDEDLQAWLNDFIWPREAKLNDELVYVGSKLAMAEMIKTGTTMFNDMYFYMDQTAKAVDESGMRALLGYGMIDLSDEDKRKSELNITKKFIKDHHNAANGRINVAVAPHAPYTCSEELLVESKKIADNNNLKLHIHVSETKSEVDDLKKEKGMTPFEYLDNIGLLSSDTIAAHGVWTTDSEIKLLSDRGVSISHNPSSNMKLASGIAPVSKYIDNDVNVSIGTDGVSSNNNLDMFSEMKTTALLQKVDTLNPKTVPAKDAYMMATVNGAKALGVNSGEIKVGKLADIILVDTRVPHLTPLRDPLSSVVYSALGSDVDTVICDGQILMENKELTTINEQEAIDDCIEASKELD